MFHTSVQIIHKNFQDVKTSFFSFFHLLIDKGFNKSQIY